MGKHDWYRWRFNNYMQTYEHYGLGRTYTNDRMFIRTGFLYQEPNPDYDLWLVDNCTPIKFIDWLKDIIPPGHPRPKPGPKAVVGSIYPRPIVCVETGKFYNSVTECKNETGIWNCYEAAEGKILFAHNMRFTFIEPFME